MLWIIFGNLLMCECTYGSILNNQINSVKIQVIPSISQVCGWLGFSLRLASPAFQSSPRRVQKNHSKILGDISDYTGSLLC